MGGWIEAGKIVGNEEVISDRLECDGMGSRGHCQSGLATGHAPLDRAGLTV